MPEQAVREFLERNGTDRKKVITVGFSGGADSVCLLSCLADAGCNVRAVHVHHMMRAQEARRDADFARDFCARRGIAFRLMQVNVPQYARDNGLTPEQAARCLRYRALREAAGGGLIAVAHNLNDQAETVLMRLVRGSGTAGLAAMQEVSGDIIRPLLYVSRKRIEEYCREHGLAYVTDSTNLEPDCTRNILRLEVLPMLEKINPDAVKCIVRTSLLAKSDEEYLRAQAVACAETIMTVQGGSVIIDARGLLQLPPALAGRVLRLGMERADSTVDFELHHVQACLELCRGQSGRRLSLARGVTALYSGGSLLLIPPEKAASCKTEKAAQKGTAALNGKGKGAVSPAEEGAELPFREGSFFLEDTAVRISPAGSANQADRRAGCEYIFLPDTAGVVLRRRRSGDRIHPLGAPGSKSLKKFLIDKKVPLHKRDSLVLAARGSEVLAIIGLTVAQSAAVKGQSGGIYRIEIIDGSAGASGNNKTSEV